MNTMKRNVLVSALSCVAALSAVVLSVTAAAQGVPKEGSYDFTSCWSGVANPVNFSKTHSGFIYEMTGTTRSAQSGDLFDKLTFRCIGLNYTFDGKLSATTICESVDKDGDKRLTHFAADGPKAVRTQIAGTGKYDGMVSTGRTEPYGPFPVIKEGTFQDCNRQTGTYKLK